MYTFIHFIKNESTKELFDALKKLHIQADKMVAKNGVTYAVARSKTCPSPHGNSHKT